MYKKYTKLHFNLPVGVYRESRWAHLLGTYFGGKAHEWRRCTPQNTASETLQNHTQKCSSIFLVSCKREGSQPTKQTSN